MPFGGLGDQILCTPALVLILLSQVVHGGVLEFAGLWVGGAFVGWMDILLALFFLNQLGCVSFKLFKDS